jgi:DNA-binding Xre family transcriptional regulator
LTFYCTIATINKELIGGLRVVKLRVREIAEAQGLNAHALSVKAGIAYSTITDVWHDRIRRIDKKTIDRLCRALSVPPGELFEWDPTKEEEIEEPELVAA